MLRVSNKMGASVRNKISQKYNNSIFKISARYLMYGHAEE